MVARLGGDEFVVAADCRTIPRRSALPRPRASSRRQRALRVDGHQVVIGTSIGIAIAPDDGVDAETLLKHADLALYRAKADGAAPIASSSRRWTSALQARRELEHDLRTALAQWRVRAQLSAARQPRDATQISGFEALAALAASAARAGLAGRIHPARRGDRPDRADRRMGAAEACAEAATLARRTSRSRSTCLAVQFKTARLVDIGRRARWQRGLGADRLELEITESVLLQDSERRSRSCTSCATSACALRWTTSAPAIRR